jgi:hypothetical protein
MFRSEGVIIDVLCIWVVPEEGADFYHREAPKKLAVIPNPRGLSIFVFLL